MLIKKHTLLHHTAMTILAVVLCLLFAVMSQQVSAADSEQENHPPRLADNAGLLSSSEKKRLTAMLDEISERYRFDTVIVTVSSTGYRTAEEYADDFYDYGGYGFGAGCDGALLLVSMNDREWHISTTGFGITAMTDAGLEYMEDMIVPSLSDGNYAEAFETFAELCDDFVRQAKTGEPYTRRTLPHKALSPAFIPLSLLFGLIVALISVSCMKSKLKTVRRQPAANSYIRNGSFALTESRDTFLYRNVIRRPKPKDTAASGGSRTHTGSSGTSHGGRGGRF